MPLSPSHLRFDVESSTDQNSELTRSDEDVTVVSTSPLARAVSKLSLSGSQATHRDSSSVSPKAIRRPSYDPPDSLPAEDLDSDDDEESSGGKTRGVKGLIGRLKRVGHREHREGSSSANASREDVSDCRILKGHADVIQLVRTPSKSDRSRQGTPLLRTTS